MRKQIVFLTLLLTLATLCQAQMRLAVLEPEGKGLSKEEQWMLSLVQSTIAADFNKYSPITIIDRQNLEAIIAEQKHSLSAITSDEDAIKIGNLANASHILTGKITKTPNAFMLELAITDAETGERKASHSPQSVTPGSIENLSALKEASADLLKQLGVSLTDSQLAELSGPVANAQVQAQTALAHGVVAERQGTSVAALSYYYQAAAFDPTLVEAVKRSSVMFANISGINIGDNIRNDIVWRKKWVEQLKETEETFHKIINAANPPYTLYYSTAIETKNINYQTETADLSISLSLVASAEWFNAMQRVLKAAQAVMGGLNATGRKKDWGLDKWPEQGVSDANPFASKNQFVSGFGNSYDYSWQYNISVEFELVNQQGRVIGKKTTELNPYFGFSKNFSVRFNTNQSSILTFNAVNANDISDNLTIRPTSVNDAPPETARFAIAAVSGKEFPEYPKRTTFTDSRDGRKYRAVEIGAQTWMAENLNFNAKGSKCYGNDPSNCQKYGRLYDRNAALTACPKGWHLPSDREWFSLKDFANGAEGLIATSGWLSRRNFYINTPCPHFYMDSYGFSALPGGKYDKLSRNDFYDVGNFGYWWSSSSKSGSYFTCYIDNHIEPMYNYGKLCTNKFDGYEFKRDPGKSVLFSVRCVQD